ncbi:MAG: tetratricopeptide repeat protein, partial [Promethearchaeota archaeon]
MEALSEINLVQGKGSEYIQMLSEIAMLQLEIQQYDIAEENFKTCLDFFKKQKDRLGQAAVLGLLGTLYYKRNIFKDSIYHYRKAHLIYNELHQYKEEITCLMGIGISHVKLNQLKEASNVFLECCELCSDSDDIYGLLNCLEQLIYIYEKEENWDVLFELYKKTLKAFKEIQDNKGVIIAYFNLGIIKRKKVDQEHALRYFKKGTNMAIDSNYSELIIKGLSYVAEIMFYLGNIRDATFQLIKALYISEKINAKNAILQITVLLKSFGLDDR